MALLVWLAWRKRGARIVTRGPRRGQPVASRHRPWRHIARFLLMGAYTGTRAAAIAGAAFEPMRGRGCTPGIMSGDPCIQGTRVLAEQVLLEIQAGRTEAEILLDHPTLFKAISLTRHPGPSAQHHRPAGSLGCI